MVRMLSIWIGWKWLFELRIDDAAAAAAVAEWICFVDWNDMIHHVMGEHQTLNKDTTLKAANNNEKTIDASMMIEFYF